MDPGLWKVARYKDFLDARRALIARKLNEFMSSLVHEAERPHHRPVVELISLGESVTLEFKSSLQWDVVQNRQNTGLRGSVLKTVAALLNTEGGTLVIGVEDQGTVCGIGPDLSLLAGSRDRFEQLLSSLTFEHLGAGATPYVKQRFEDVDGRTVCVVDVDRSNEPVFTKGEKGREFFVRVGNTTRALDAEETLKYLESRGSGA
jgi:predicted HTH transcriptional regulator